MNNRGSLSVEFILAAALLIILASAFLSSMLFGQDSSYGAGNYNRATMLASEGMEAVRMISNNSFSSVSAGTHGLSSSSIWSFSGSSDNFGIFTREIDVSTVDADRKDVEVTVSWENDIGVTKSVTMQTRLTNWQQTASDTATSTGSSTCASYCSDQGYSAGTCRQNPAKCSQNGETYESGGDVYCTGGANSDTCCCI